VDLKIGDEISDSKLCFSVAAKCGDTTERDEIVKIGGLDENEDKLFARFSFKIAEGKDPENARDRLQSTLTKWITYVSSHNPGFEGIILLFDFKYRINGEHVDVYIFVDYRAQAIQMFEENAWSKIEGFFNPIVT